MKIKNRHSIYLFILFILVSCKDNTLYYSYQSTPATGWSKSDTLLFEVPVRDSLSLLQITTELRSSDTYPFKELWIATRSNLKNKEIEQTDTLLFTLTDEYGSHSKQGWSCLLQTKNTASPVFVKDTGIYVIKINHLMNEEFLNGIHDVGIKITKH